MKADYRDLFHFVREREAIRVHKTAGLPAPHTYDAILSTYRFCNVRREDDRGTVWIRENIREPFADHPHLWFMLCIARQINWPDTLAELMRAGAWPGSPQFTPCYMAEILNARKARGDKVYTGAYMISAPATKGTDKQSYIAETVLGNIWDARGEAELVVSLNSLQNMHTWLMEFNGWGPFMAYQAVVDMRFTRILRDAADVSTWAAAGPGTLRGLNRIHGRPVAHSLSQKQALDEMRAIFEVVSNLTGVAMDFSDVPNILCETDKYIRVRNGEGKPRALYVEGRGS